MSSTSTIARPAPAVTTASLAALPKVDLLPPEVAEEQRFARVRAALVASLVLSLGAVGGLYALAVSDVGDARAELDVVQARTAALTTTKADYAEVPLVFAQVDGTKAKLAAALGQEVRWSYQLNDLGQALPSSVWVEDISVGQSALAGTVPSTPATGTAATGTTGTTPMMAAPAYTLTVTGKAERVEDVAAWLDLLADRPGWTNSFVTSAAVEVEDGRKVTTFTSTVDVGGEALSGRYALAGTTPTGATTPATSSTTPTTTPMTTTTTPTTAGQ